MLDIKLETTLLEARSVTNLANQLSLLFLLRDYEYSSHKTILYGLERKIKMQERALNPTTATNTPAIIITPPTRLAKHEQKNNHHQIKLP